MVAGSDERRAWAAPLRVHQTAQRINARRITVIISKLTTVIMKYEMVVTKSRSVIWWSPFSNPRQHSHSMHTYSMKRAH